MNKEKIIIVLLIVLLMWFGFTIVRLENYHYAVQVGFCDEYSGVEKLTQRNNCLNEVQTRTNPLYHLMYGLKIF